jgi:iron complex outermembrane receptor protein
LLLLRALAGISTVTLAHAADLTLDEVHVTAPMLRKDLQPDSLSNPYAVPMSNRAGTETFTQEDIENLHPRDLFELLDLATGVNVTYQGRKNPYFVRERGGGSFTYILDGAILPTVTQRILQRIPLAAIEELKVVRDATALTIGPLISIGSSSSGSGVTTGFIIIRTHQPKGTEARLTKAMEKAEGQPTATTEYGYAGLRVGAAPSDKEGLSAYVGGFISRFDRPSLPTWFDGQDGDARLETAGFGNEHASLSLTAYDEYGRFEMQRGINVTTGALDASRWYYAPANTSVYTAAGTLNWSPSQVTLLSLFETNYNQKETDGVFNASGYTTPTASDYWDKTRGFSVRHNARFDNTYVNLGWQNARSWALGNSGPTPSTRWDSTVNGYALSAEQRLLDQHLFLDAGYRMDNKHMALTDTTTKMQNIDLPAAKVFSLGGRWIVAPQYTLNTRYFNGDQGGSSAGFDFLPLPGKTLSPEKQSRYEIGTQANWSREINAGLTWFDVNIKNQKTQSSTSYVLNGASYYYYTQADSRRKGLELLVQGELASLTTYKASWTHMVYNVSAGADQTKLTPDDMYSVALNQEWGAYKANLTLRSVSHYMGSQTPAAQLGGYTRVDTNVMRDFRWLDASFHSMFYVRNIENVHYYTQQGPTGLYPDRGRTVGFEISVGL